MCPALGVWSRIKFKIKVNPKVWEVYQVDKSFSYMRADVSSRFVCVHKILEKKNLCFDLMSDLQSYREHQSILVRKTIPIQWGNNRSGWIILAANNNANQLLNHLTQYEWGLKYGGKRVVQMNHSSAH